MLEVVIDEVRELRTLVFTRVLLALAVSLMKLIYERSSCYKFAIKDDGASSVDLSPFFGKGLVTSWSLYEPQPSEYNTWSTWGYLFKADGTMDNYSGLYKPALDNPSENSGYTNGWTIRDYT